MKKLTTAILFFLITFSVTSALTIAAGVVAHGLLGGYTVKQENTIEGIFAQYSQYK